MRAIADSGFVIAAVNRDDRWHERCLQTYREFDSIFIPQTTLTEIAYILRRQAGSAAVIAFLQQIPNTRYLAIALQDDDLIRTTELLHQYRDTRVDFVDATVCAIAERLNIHQILTVDRRDFQILRPRHTDYFELLP
jgi:uncharacterized protein